jgi:hypothetical protein
MNARAMQSGREVLRLRSMKRFEDASFLGFLIEPRAAMCGTQTVTGTSTI